MKVALCARVSTAHKDQDPETQLVHLRDFCRTQGWEVYQEYVDTASALDVARHCHKVHRMRKVNLVRLVPKSMTRSSQNANG